MLEIDQRHAVKNYLNYISILLVFYYINFLQSRICKKIFLAPSKHNRRISYETEEIREKPLSRQPGSQTCVLKGNLGVKFHSSTAAPTAW